MASWFFTRTGRWLTRGSVGVLAFGMCGAKMALNGPCIDWFQKTAHLYSKSEPLPLIPAVKAQAQQVLKECGLSKKQEDRVTFFYVASHELFNAGALNSPWGAIVGLPFTFSFKTAEEINMSGMKLLANQDIDYDSGGKELQHSLSLSDNAKKFAIAREIYSCDLNNVLVDAISSALLILFPARLIYLRNKKGDQFIQRRLISRLPFYFSCYVFGLIVVKVFKGLYVAQFENSCDAKVANLSPEYLDGGLEFYEKTLKKHMALKRLMANVGSYWYDEDGNLNRFIFWSHLPITYRLACLRDLKKQVNDKSVS